MNQLTARCQQRNEELYSQYVALRLALRGHPCDGDGQVRGATVGPAPPR